jgi:hypothetical protein
MHPSTQKTAAPSWDEIKKSIAGGYAKAVSKAPEGMQTFLANHGEDVARGLAGATIAGGLYGVTANRRAYENDEEFRSRRFRGALQTALLGGTLAGFAAPVKKYLETKVPEARKQLNISAQQAQINSDPELGHGDLRVQKGLASGMKREDIAGPDPVASKPTWMMVGEGGNAGITGTGVIAGAAGGQAIGGIIGRANHPLTTEGTLGEIGKRLDKVDIAEASRKSMGRKQLSQQGWQAKNEARALQAGGIRRGLARGAYRTGGGVLGGLAGRYGANILGDKFEEWMQPEWYNPNFADTGAEGLALPGGQATATPPTGPSISPIGSGGPGGNPRWNPPYR